MCVEPCQWSGVQQAVGGLSLIGSYLGVQIQAGAWLVFWGQRRALLLQDSHTVLPTNSSALRYRSLPGRLFLLECRSVSLNLGGTLSKMVTLWIKHAAVSNFSFYSFVSCPECSFSFPVSHRSDGRRISHLGNRQDFYTHGGGMCSFILSLLFLCSATHTILFKHLMFMPKR